MLLRASLTALTLFSISGAAHTLATEPAGLSNLAVSLGVSINDITSLDANVNLTDFKAEAWTDYPGAKDWSEDVKEIFFVGLKSIVHDALDESNYATGSLVKRGKGSDSPAARAQIQKEVDNAKVTRDSSSRRKLLQCNSGTQAKCTRCAAACSIIYAGSVAGCSAAALGAETLTSGLATPAVLIGLAGCLAVSSGQYWQCIESCIG